MVFFKYFLIKYRTITILYVLDDDGEGSIASRELVNETYFYKFIITYNTVCQYTWDNMTANNTSNNNALSVFCFRFENCIL